MTGSLDGKEDQATMEMSPEEEDGEVWYFGFGPIVHPQVRQRRGLKTSDCQAAVLQDHRLTFAFGGVATVVPQVGFTVHGVVMKLPDMAAWKKLKSFDAGYYVEEEVDVFPYKKEEYDDGDLDDFFAKTTPIQCYAFVLNEFDESCLQRNIVEKKPQERYLRLIADGMVTHGVDETYVGDEIMSCPFIASRKEEEWQSFPHVRDPLPRISFPAYQKLCKRQPKDLYFIVNNLVMKADSIPESNNAVEWMKSHAHGKPDISHLVHQMIVDPRLPYAETEQEMSERHYKWVFNHVFEFLQQADVAAKAVFIVRPSNTRQVCWPNFDTPSLSSLRKSLRASLGK
uniref:gamma-glutamylcyclotransferase n=1 Tax=Entomoneis paludosa TaxID=265537 RepID=A0A6U3BJA8_9STRA|mmetsp:Transcript_30649/g.64022  ORF Transcript_30649/g.64022 Transcript_30649/m.64022 type:complete len:341 (+) Transcript_30649:328-1350(+)|eukprot:CAMPEP_0172439168 /NCGR_PEP_ID=MMETSP1065-20121228/239_1 /TAXON_ID=265537 /ORGANISM="Amphiprora paludosa, Strain CCMP125" /LENGTH=340 /DNA_ID=CAMNT_0013187811 /DNA_START=297 /DNA_END=1319 /DNA_ORIENTATION=-